jgi:hypothetical protein
LPVLGNSLDKIIFVPGHREGSYGLSSNLNTRKDILGDQGP